METGKTETSILIIERKAESQKGYRNDALSGPKKPS